jgi:AcrR family transcriptional regulator
MNEELKKILLKVRGLYIRYGIKSVTMDDVARELGISKKTLYQHVADKNDLVAKVFEMQMNENTQSFEYLFNDGSNAIDQLLVAFEWIAGGTREYSLVSDYTLKKYYPDLHSRITRSRQEHFIKFIKRNLIQGQEEGLFRNDLDVNIISKIHAPRIQNAFDPDPSLNNERLSPEALYEFFKYHIRGIASAEGIAVFDGKHPKEQFQRNELQLEYE